MKYILKNALVYRDGSFKKCDLYVADGRIAEDSAFPINECGRIFDFKNCFVFPGFVDVHVHLREPGFSYKETIRTGTEAAAHGGYSAVCSMPNLNPVPDSRKNLAVQAEIIKRDARVRVYPYGAITVGEQGCETVSFEELSPGVIGFSDDGRGVQSSELMEKAMREVKKCGKIIAAHCEDNSLLHGGCIHDGEYAKRHGLPGICSESEYKPIMRDIELAKKTGCPYHVCHISASQSVEAIRRAKAEGVDISCETAPHYLVFCDTDLKDSGSFKMNPPLRSARDRQALLEGIADGTIDMLATDHAPHSEEEKSRGLKNSLMGIVGLETAFALMYTELVKGGIITLERLIELMAVNPRRRFGICGGTEIGDEADFTVFDLENEYEIDKNSFFSKGRSTPFDRRRVFGSCLMTAVGGEIVFEDTNRKDERI